MGIIIFFLVTMHIRCIHHVLCLQINAHSMQTDSNILCTQIRSCRFTVIVIIKSLTSYLSLFSNCILCTQIQRSDIVWIQIRSSRYTAPILLRGSRLSTTGTNDFIIIIITYLYNIYTCVIHHIYNIILYITYYTYI